MKRVIDSKRFRFDENTSVELPVFSTKIKPVYQSSAHYKELLADHIRCMRSYQEKLYGSNKHSVLLIFQAMDAAGKDGAIKHVMSGVNPQGCQVHSFKPPSRTELQHDFLWRSSLCLPEMGRIGIFNRSYYEDVLIAKIHPDRLANTSADNDMYRDPLIWEGRYDSIRDHEKHLNRNGTCIIKIFLHMSEAEQKKRFIARIEDPAKSWKFRPEDLEERKFWRQYMAAYEQCFKATSSDFAPWYIVPADDKKNARLIVSQILCDALKDLDLAFPVLSKKRRKELLKARNHLMNMAD